MILPNWLKPVGANLDRVARWRRAIIADLTRPVELPDDTEKEDADWQADESHSRLANWAFVEHSASATAFLRYAGHFGLSSAEIHAWCQGFETALALGAFQTEGQYLMRNIARPPDTETAA